MLVDVYPKVSVLLGGAASVLAALIQKQGAALQRQLTSHAYVLLVAV